MITAGSFLACLLSAVAVATVAAASSTSAAVIGVDSRGVAAGEAAAADQCPCAYLERGGFWNSAVAKSLGIVGQVFIEKRCRCEYELNCDRRWKVSDKSLTMTWLGSNGISDTEIQLQFCSLLFGPSVQPCRTGSGSASEVAFTLKQVGWWIDLIGINCRCPQTASISAFRYLQPLSPGDGLRSQMVEFACTKLIECAPKEPCYNEDLNSNGMRTGGRVLCSCRSGTYCPIYKPTIVQRNDGNASSRSTGDNKILCKPES